MLLLNFLAQMLIPQVSIMSDHQQRTKNTPRGQYTHQLTLFPPTLFPHLWRWLSDFIGILNLRVHRFQRPTTSICFILRTRAYLHPPQSTNKQTNKQKGTATASPGCQGSSVAGAPPTPPCPRSSSNSWPIDCANTWEILYLRSCLVMKRYPGEISRCTV